MIYVSKSMIAASSCEYHFAQLYLSGYKGPSIANEPALTGSQFHAFMSQYIRHLAAAGLSADLDFVWSYLKSNDLTEDAADLIERNARGLQVEPETLLGTELFLSINEHGGPVEKIQDSVPGYRPEGGPARFGGTLDWVRLEGDTASIVDWKTTWTMLSVDDAEAAMYALLVFQHYGFVKTVNFQWYFARLFKAKSVTWERKDAEEHLWPLVNRAYQHLVDIEQRYQAGETLSVNPMSGRCPFCPLACPLNSEVLLAAGGATLEVAVPPIQDLAMARSMAQSYYVAKLFANRAEQALKRFVDVHGSVDMGLGFTASVETRTCRSHPLQQSLELMGLRLVETCPDCEGTGTGKEGRANGCQKCGGFGDVSAGAYTPLYDVPLERLTIGGLSGFAKAKKREELRSALAVVATEKHQTILRIRRAEDKYDLIGDEE